MTEVAEKIREIEQNNHLTSCKHSDERLRMKQTLLSSVLLSPKKGRQRKALLALRTDAGSFSHRTLPRMPHDTGFTIAVLTPTKQVHGLYLREPQRDWIRKVFGPANLPEELSEADVKVFFKYVGGSFKPVKSCEFFEGVDAVWLKHP